jgi:hypothetical protein
MPDTLSPAAQAVMTALLQFKFGEEADLVDFPRMSRILGPELAVALRAAADQVIPDDPFAAPLWTERDEIRAALFAIADELEGK